MVNIILHESDILSYFASSHFFEIFTFQNSWHWKCKLGSWCTTFTVMPFDGKVLTSYLKAIIMCTFFQSSQNSNLKFDLENLGQGHRVPHLRWSNSMANVNIYKLNLSNICYILFRDIYISNFTKFITLKCRPRSWCTTFAVTLLANAWLPIWRL